jgi:hypothetical protein
VFDLANRIIKEATIDFPQEGLPPGIWDEKDGEYTLKKKVKSDIFKSLRKYPDLDLIDMSKELHFIGSAGTNMWDDASDVDVHVVVNHDLPKDKTPDAWQKDVREYYKDNPQHTVGRTLEFYMQLHPTQEFMADAVYDLETDKWIKGPKIVPMDYDPYEKFDHVLADIKDTVGEADELLGELKRDVIDYKTIKDAVSRMPKDVKKKLKDKLSQKLNDIEADIEELLKTKEEWILMRKHASIPKTPEQALKDVEYARRWNDQNALFKFLDRYQYMQIISDLEKMLEDDEGVTDKDVGEIEDLLGVMNNSKETEE